MLAKQVWSVCHNFVYSKARLSHQGNMTAAAKCLKKKTNQGAACFLAQGKVCKSGLRGIRVTLLALQLTSCACRN